MYCPFRILSAWNGNSSRFESVYRCVYSNWVFWWSNRRRTLHKEFNGGNLHSRNRGNIKRAICSNLSTLPSLFPLQLMLSVIGLPENTATRLLSTIPFGFFSYALIWNAEREHCWSQLSSKRIIDSSATTYTNTQIVWCDVRICSHISYIYCVHRHIGKDIDTHTHLQPTL